MSDACIFLLYIYILFIYLFIYLFILWKPGILCTQQNKFDLRRPREFKA